MRRRLTPSLFGISLIILACSIVIEAQVYKGELERFLKVDFGYAGSLTPASAEVRKSLPVSVAADDRVFSTTLKIVGTSGIAAVVVIPARENAYVWVDLNRDHKFTVNERTPFSSKGYAIASLPLFGAGIFKDFPVRLVVSRKRPRKLPNSAEVGTSASTVDSASLARAAASPGEEVLDFFYSRKAIATGKVKIAGNETLVQYSYNLEKRRVDLTSGVLAMDCNWDARIDTATYAAESVASIGAPVVFRLNTIYVSTKSVNTATGQILLQSHPASDYKRIEIAIGNQVPDFSFTDFDGNRHKFSDFRGKYVLLEFWGVDCPGCVIELPYIKAAYEKYKNRGFEVIGMSQEYGATIPSREQLNAGVERARAYAKTNGMIWAQASQESIDDLTRNRFMVDGIPFILLLDRTGKIIAFDLQGRRLEEELVKLMLDKPTSQR